MNIKVKTYPQKEPDRITKVQVHKTDQKDIKVLVHQVPKDMTK